MSWVPCILKEFDIWHCADLLIQQHGEEAPEMAAELADEAMAVGDIEARQIWLRIRTAIEELLKNEPEPGDTIH